MGDRVPPLPVAVGIGGKICERRMFRITEDTEGVRGLAVRPGGVPEDTGETQFDSSLCGVGFHFAGKNGEEHGAAGA